MMRLAGALLGIALLASSACEQRDRSESEHRSSTTATSALTVGNRPLRNPFPTATEVRLFVNTGYDAKGKPLFSNPQGHLLSEAERAEFESLLKVRTVASGESAAMCFIPHHFFRYFDSSGKQVEELQVCFCCAGVEQSGVSNVQLTDSQELSADFGKLEAFVQSLGEPTKVQCS